MNFPETTSGDVRPLERYLPRAFREHIEDHFYRRIGEKAKLENLKKDDLFLENPDKHIGLYSDHSVVHVRDVARQTLQVIDRANGVIIPRRDPQTLEFLRAYGLHLAYLHDIGMVDFSDFGRFMHPEFAAQYVFSEAFDEMADLLWNDNAGNLPWRLLRLFRDTASEAKVRVIFREMLSLSATHSKSKFPITLVNDPSALCRHLRHVVSTPLQALYLEQKTEHYARLRDLSNQAEERQKAESKQLKFQLKLEKYRQDQPEEDLPARRFYTDFRREAFSWLEDRSPQGRRLIIDLIDTLRCLRAADALRQRGTVLRTSAGYEIFVDQKSANAVFALRSEDNQELYLLEGKKPINAGEANIAGSEIDVEGNLRISFHRGRFFTNKVTQKAAFNAALTIDDIQADTIMSFLRDPELDFDVYEAPARSFHDIRILMEGTEDNPDFARLAFDELRKRNPAIEHRLRVTVSLQGADLDEVHRYLDGLDFGDYFTDQAGVEQLLAKLAASGRRLEHLSPDTAFTHVRVAGIRAGERLIRSGSPSGFVYIPLADGLRVFPLGGYDSQPTPAWVPLGNTGVIRGSIRNASVFAETDLKLLMIPREIYLDHWYAPYDAPALAKAWNRLSANTK